MTDRPIIFSAPMIRALLDGRKTQTRRILKPQPLYLTARNKRVYADADYRKSWEEGSDDDLRFGAGDRLWVRETWQTGMGSDGPQITFRATPDYFDIDAWDGPDEGIGPSFNYDKCPGAKWHTCLSDLLSGVEGAWRSPIHMPRWASRLTLIVESVKVEQLQDISREDAIAEGLFLASSHIEEFWRWPPPLDAQLWLSPVEAYHSLWSIINGADSWDANPWVAAISFRVVKANIDALCEEVAS